MDANDDLVKRLADEVEQMKRDERIDGMVALDRVLTLRCQNREAPIRQDVLDDLMNRSIGRIPKDGTLRPQVVPPHPPKQVVQNYAFSGRIPPRSRQLPKFDRQELAAGAGAEARRDELDQAS
jgi:hypothetical protein